MTDITATKTQDFYEKLVHQILSGNLPEAIELFNAVSQEKDRIEILERVVKDIRSHLNHARDLASDRVRELEHAPALDRALTRARARLQDLDQALDLTLPLVRDHILDRDLTLELARALEHARARDRDPSLDRVLNPLYQMSLFLTRSFERSASRRESQGS